MLTSLDYWCALALLLGSVALTIAMVPRFLAICRDAAVGTNLLLAAILTASVLLRFWWMPSRHNVFYDEFAHLDIARNALEEQRVALRSYGPAARGSPKYVRPKWGPGYHVLLSSWWHVTGMSEGSAFCLSRVLGTMSVLMTYLFGRLLFCHRSRALWAAFLMGIYPLHVKFSSGTSTEVPSVLFLLLTLCHLMLHLRRRCGTSALATMFAAAYYALIRPENCLLGLPVICFLTWRRFDASRRGLRVLAGSVALLMPGAYHLATAMVCEIPFIRAQVSVPLGENLLFWFVSVVHPAVYSVLALLGFIVMRKRHPNTSLLFGGYFLLNVMFYSLIHRSSFMHIDFARFALNFSLATIIGATAGIGWLTTVRPKATVAVLVLVASSSAIAARTTVAPYREEMEAEMQFVRGVLPDLPPACTVFSRVPEYHRVVQGVEARSLALLLAPEAGRDPGGASRPLVLYVGIPDSGRGRQVREGLRERGWDSVALDTLAIAKGEIGFYVLGPVPAADPGDA